MSKTWLAIALIVAGIVITFYRFAFLADGLATSVFGSGIVGLIGPLLLIAGVVLLIAIERRRKG
ncbi:hypothetical protein PARPLA_01900 [Rhodobacteraceae bacterium THAF1]|uniref:hypothetical protein n=1 Tax=Palleronia sp. THAF1 TaxID=2587842 RepID=UPI000F3D26E0|nr:hypothetical protein [Palleronia sp. THAF1]QFU08965.1 hypothetical protein FIU81_09800 [Palleronia sp. THAF1]VDC24297.1 hypothetical protein PARPLA_01900 [Rhodobacteraceae bacterium THAF1]